VESLRVVQTLDSIGALSESHLSLSLAYSIYFLGETLAHITSDILVPISNRDALLFHI
jgi:hypothetical protein